MFCSVIRYLRSLVVEFRLRGVIRDCCCRLEFDVVVVVAVVFVVVVVVVVVVVLLLLLLLLLCRLPDIGVDYRLLMHFFIVSAQL